MDCNKIISICGRLLLNELKSKQSHKNSHHLEMATEADRSKNGRNVKQTGVERLTKTHWQLIQTSSTKTSTDHAKQCRFIKQMIYSASGSLLKPVTVWEGEQRQPLSSQRAAGTCWCQWEYHTRTSHPLPPCYGKLPQLPIVHFFMFSCQTTKTNFIHLQYW